MDKEPTFKEMIDNGMNAREARKVLAERRKASGAHKPTGIAQGGRRKQAAPRTQSFDHAEFGDELISEHHACFIDGAPAIWQDGGYKTGYEALERGMVQVRHGIKKQQRKETISYLELVAPRFEQTDADARLIAFKNGVLDLRTWQLTKNEPGLHIPNTICHDWNPNAECAAVDNAIRAWACNDPERMRLIGEMAGLAMYRGRDVSQAPYAMGGGENGKTQALELIRRSIGGESVAALDITTVGKRFQSIALMGKLANIADDVALEKIAKSELSVVKRAITKDTIQYEVKGGKVSYFRPYCAQIFSGNALPQVNEADRAIARRFVVIPFEADFSGGRGDNTIERQLSTVAACERMLVIGAHALKDLLDRGGKMTVARDSAENTRRLLSEASSVAAFAYDVLEMDTGGARDITGESTELVFEEYVGYCEGAKRPPVARARFTSEICNLLKLDTKRTWFKKPNGGRSQKAAFTARKNRH